MVKPCNTCGDIGVVEAIVVCCECQDVREHLYCMREVKMQTPEWWCCDECEQNKLSSPSPKTVENEPKTQTLSVILQQTASVKESEPKSRSPSQLGFKEKWANKGKTQFISFNEAVKLSSGSVKPNTLRKEFGSPNKMSTRVFRRSTGLNEKTTPFGSERSLFQSPQKERNVGLNLRQPVVQQSSSPKAIRSSMPSSSVEGTKPEREMKTSISELLHPKKAADISVLKEESHKLFKEHEKTGTASGSQTNADVEAAGKPNLTMLARAEQEIIHDVPISEMHDPYIPSFNSYWKGCFNLPNGSQEFNETFTGHLPSKTHYKVYEATKKLPENISFELVSNCEIRTEIFPADTDDIGLYFFPISKTRSERDIPIIDFIWRNDLALKTNVENVELFVLSSRVLPAHAQEFQGNYFLWGIFRRLKIARNVADTSPLTVKKCALCADAPPGFERICKHATKREPCADAPPGFERICKQTTRREPCADVPPGFKRICRR